MQTNTYKLSPTMKRCLRHSLAQFVKGHTAPGYSSFSTGGSAEMSYTSLRALARRGLVARIDDYAGYVEAYCPTDEGLVVGKSILLELVEEEAARARRLLESPYLGIRARGVEILSGVEKILSALSQAVDAVA